jgi:hypothetical protein
LVNILNQLNTLWRTSAGKILDQENFMSLNQLTGQRESSAMPQRVRDVLGRLKVSVHQNVYEADFEYGAQPLRWEALTQGAGSVTQIPSSGGVRMRVGNAQGDVSLRQSRPYHRYQPGKTMFMATACQLGPATSGNLQRVGFFDDSNGAFFEQGQPTQTNPYGLYIVVRTDIGGQVSETRVGLDSWNGDTTNIRQLDFTRIQMFWLEYAWYGAGVTRFGFWINGEPVIAHQIGWGNYNNTVNGSGPQTTPWARTGNLPVRYEQRNITAITPTTNDMYHYGVSVIVEGQRDEQRGFTYSYGMALGAQTRQINTANTRIPLLSIRGRAMGTNEFGNIYGRYDTGATPNASSTFASSFTGYISGTTLTLTGATPVVSGTIAIGSTLSGVVGIVPYTVITAGSGTTTGSTWTVSPSQTVGSAASPVTFTGAGNYFTYGTAQLPATNTYQGRQVYFPSNGASSVVTPTGQSGAALATTLTVTAGQTAGIFVGAIVTGTGVNPTTNSFTYVTQISGNTITLSQPLNSAVSTNTLTFTTTVGSGAIGRIVYHTTTALYFCDPVFQNSLPVAPTIVTTAVTSTMTAGSAGNGVLGSYTILFASTTGITVGMSVTGVNIAPGSQVTGVVTNTSITVNLPCIGTVTATTATFNTGFIIGLANRGQLLPRRLMMTATAQVLVEIIASTPTNLTSISGANFNALQFIGSPNSFAERDVIGGGSAATPTVSMTGGEVVFAFVLSAGAGLQDIDFSYFFPLYNNIRGSGVDTLTIATSAPASSLISANLICQEAMS